MFKDKNRNEVFYWNCDRKQLFNCRGRATTILQDKTHYLKNKSEHNHQADATRFEISETSKKLKKRARTTREDPAQITTYITDSTSEIIRPSLPNDEALRKKIKRLRKADVPNVPNSLENLILQPEYMMTSN